MAYPLSVAVAGHLATLPHQRRRLGAGSRTRTCTGLRPADF